MITKQKSATTLLYSKETATYPFVFEWIRNGSLVVIGRTEAGVATTLVQGRDYTVEAAYSPAAVLSGGTVRITSPADWSFAILTIARDTEALQNLDLLNGSPIDAEDLEAALDRLTLISQESKYRIDRGIFASPEEAGDEDITPDLALPPAKFRKGKAVGFDETGNHIKMIDDPALSADRAETAAGAAADSASAAAGSASAAAQSKANAKTSEDNAKTSENNASSSESTALSYKNAAGVSASEALASQNAAKDSENAAALSETNAGGSETAAALSATNASDSETAAAASQRAAHDSQVAAKASQDAAALSAHDATISEGNAKTSETNASTSETNAKTSETNSKASERATEAAANRTAANLEAFTALKTEMEALATQTHVTTVNIDGVFYKQGVVSKRGRVYHILEPIVPTV